MYSNSAALASRQVQNRVAAACLMIALCINEIVMFHNVLYVIQPECHEASNGITSSKRSSLGQFRYKCSVVGAKARALAGRGGFHSVARAHVTGQALYADKTNLVREICKTLNISISRATLYRYIKAG